MERVVGTVVRGLRGPIINNGDNIEEIVVQTVLNAATVEGFSIEDRDIVTVTESIVARAQGNYATIDNIAADIKAKFGEETVGVIFLSLAVTDLLTACVELPKEQKSSLNAKLSI